MLRSFINWWKGNRDADWKGKLHRRFVLLHWRHEWGRWCYQTDCCGETKKCWWERDLKVEAEEQKRLLPELNVSPSDPEATWRL